MTCALIGMSCNSELQPVATRLPGVWLPLVKTQDISEHINQKVFYHVPANLMGWGGS